MTDSNKETIQQFTYSIPIPMRWNDLDPLGHVNNMYYFEYYQIVRGKYMNVASEQWDWSKNMFVIAHIQSDFMRELSFGHKNPKAWARVTNISNKSFEMEYLITSTAKDGSDIIHAKGKSVNVMIDTETKRSTEIPEWLRKDLMAYEPALKE